MLKSQPNTQTGPVRGQTPRLSLPDHALGTVGHVCGCSIKPCKKHALNLSWLPTHQKKTYCWCSNPAEHLFIGPIWDTPYGLYICIHEERRAACILCCSGWVTSVSSSNMLKLLSNCKDITNLSCLWHSAWTDASKQTFSKNEKEVALIF